MRFREIKTNDVVEKFPTLPDEIIDQDGANNLPSEIGLKNTADDDRLLKALE